MYKVLIIVGSDSDLPKVEACTNTLKEFGVEYSLRIASAHRTPDLVSELSQTAQDKGYGVIIAAAGMSAALPGSIAAQTDLPVIGLPLDASTLGGMDALLSITQMPPGIPVLSVGINAANNAALAALRILSVSDPFLTKKLAGRRSEMAQKVLAKDAKLQQLQE